MHDTYNNHTHSLYTLTPNHNPKRFPKNSKDAQKSPLRILILLIVQRENGPSLQVTMSCTLRAMHTAHTRGHATRRGVPAYIHGHAWSEISGSHTARLSMGSPRLASVHVYPECWLERRRGAGGVLLLEGVHDVEGGEVRRLEIVGLLELGILVIRVVEVIRRVLVGVIAVRQVLGNLLRVPSNAFQALQKRKKRTKRNFVSGS